MIDCHSGSTVVVVYDGGGALSPEPRLPQSTGGKSIDADSDGK